MGEWYLGIGWEVGNTGTNLGQLAICSWTLGQETMWDLIFTRVTWEQTHNPGLVNHIVSLYVCSVTHQVLTGGGGLHQSNDSKAEPPLTPTFLSQPLQGALNEASCFSTLEERSTFLGSKGTRQSGQRGEVTWRHGWRHSPQNLDEDSSSQRFTVCFRKSPTHTLPQPSVLSFTWTPLFIIISKRASQQEVELSLLWFY